MTHPENATGLEGLAERVEAATGALFALDCEIGKAVGSAAMPPRAYTASLDAVRTLIDSSDEWELTTLYGVARAAVGLNRDQQTHWTGYGEHLCGDPVLALLAAALRARQQEAKNHGCP